MKRNVLLLLTASCIQLAACNHSRARHQVKEKDLFIGIQPIGAFSLNKVRYISSEIGRVFHKNVIIMHSQDMPAMDLDTTKGLRYSADSLLSIFRPDADSRMMILILTDDDIYTTVRDEKGRIKTPLYKYKVWGIFGLGDCPGAVSIVSDYRLHAKDTAEYHHRLRTVVLHELGHNFGLQHCPTPHCIMNDANEKIATIDNSYNDYCSDCRKKLGLQ